MQECLKQPPSDGKVICEEKEEGKAIRYNRQ